MAAAPHTSLLIHLLFTIAALASPVPQQDQQGAPQVDNEGGGAGGNSTSYGISTGGLIAVIVVVVVVAILGVASAVLFVVAKRRQWQVRETIKRASRRVASRMSMSASRPGSRSASRADVRRGAVRMNSPPGSKTRVLDKNEKNTRVTEKREAARAGGPPTASSGLRNEAKAPAPKERMEVDDNSRNTDADAGKRWKAILPPSWSVGGKK